MRGYSELKVFRGEELDLLRKATALVEALPQPDNLNGLRCHELARAVGKVLGLPVQDGKYGAVEHTWLWSTPEPPFTAILDVYCVGSIPQVRLVDLWTLLPHLRTHYSEGAYVPGDLREDIDTAMVKTLVDFFTLHLHLHSP